MSSLVEIEKEIAAENEKDVMYETKEINITSKKLSTRLLEPDKALV